MSTSDSRLCLSFPLEIVAKQIIEPIPENDNFIANPDDVNEHDPAWHQFGIISHTAAAYSAYTKEFEVLMKNWQLYDFIHEKLNETIDGKQKKELLEFALILHDIGKFQRSLKYVYGCGFVPDYEGHEGLSEKIILDRSKSIYPLLTSDYQLTDNQINYIAKCAGLHYELGKIRKKAYKDGGGFTLSYVDSLSCESNLKAVQHKHEGFNIEIGVLFLCDNLAKTNIRISVVSDEEIELMTDEIKNVIQQSDLHPNLIYAIKQLPVSVYLAHKYFLLLKSDN